jgi:hypothetical protein
MRFAIDPPQPATPGRRCSKPRTRPFSGVRHDGRSAAREPRGLLFVEVRADSQGRGDVSVGLSYCTRKLRPREWLQLVRDLDRPLEKSSSKVLPLASWPESLPFE